MCPVCLIELATKTTFRLACDHVLCTECATAAAEAGHEACPVCREPHELNLAKLDERLEAFREGYGKWRRGEPIRPEPSVGEMESLHLPSPIRRSASGKSLHSDSAGDLVLLEQRALESEGSMKDMKASAEKWPKASAELVAAPLRAFAGAAPERPPTPQVGMALPEDLRHPPVPVA